MKVVTMAKFLLANQVCETCSRHAERNYIYTSTGDNGDVIVGCRYRLWKKPGVNILTCEEWEDGR